MKNYKRAYRRYKQYVKFKRRLDNWFKGCRYPAYKDEVYQQALKGQACTWLRTTGNPCNCSMCQYYKYERLPKQKIMKEVWKAIEEDEGLKKLLYYKTNQYIYSITNNK